MKYNLVEYLLELGDGEVYYENDNMKIIKLFKNTEEFLVIKNDNNVIFDTTEEKGKVVIDCWEFVTKKMSGYTFRKDTIDKMIGKIEGMTFSTSIFKRNLKKDVWSHTEVINNGAYITLNVYEKGFNIEGNKKWVSENPDKLLITMNINKGSMIENGKYGMTITFHEDAMYIFNVIDTYIKRYFRNNKFRL